MEILHEQHIQTRRTALVTVLLVLYDILLEWNEVISFIENAKFILIDSEIALSS